MKHWRDSTDKNVLEAAVVDLKRRCEAAFHFCQEDVASEAHEDLIAAEWRLRQAERRA